MGVEGVGRRVWEGSEGVEGREGSAACVCEVEAALRPSSPLGLQHCPPPPRPPERAPGHAVKALAHGDVGVLHVGQDPKREERRRGGRAGGRLWTVCGVGSERGRRWRRAGGASTPGAAPGARSIPTHHRAAIALSGDARVWRIWRVEQVPTATTRPPRTHQPRRLQAHSSPSWSPAYHREGAVESVAGRASSAAQVFIGEWHWPPRRPALADRPPTEPSEQHARQCIPERLQAGGHRSCPPRPVHFHSRKRSGAPSPAPCVPADRLGGGGGCWSAGEGWRGGGAGRGRVGAVAARWRCAPHCLGKTAWTLCVPPPRAGTARR